MSKSNIEDFWKFINERHSIYLKRIDKQPPPWSNDPIFQEHKFTNVFRELDPTTIGLRRMLKQLYDEYKTKKDVVNKTENLGRFVDPEVKENMLRNYIRNQFITCILYRLFNWKGNAQFGPITNPTAWYYYLKGQLDNGQRIIGDAYPILSTVEDKNKLTILELVCREIVTDADGIISKISNNGRCTLEWTWNVLKCYNCIGSLIAYEFVCDLRYTDILRNATDTCTWCYISPDDESCLERLGVSTTLESIRNLFNKSFDTLRYCEGQDTNHPENHWINQHYNLCSLVIQPRYPYWELSEIEHCLRQFDKYERIRGDVSS